MTARTHPTTTAPIDYAATDAAVGLDWWQADPNLRQLVERLPTPEDRRLRREAVREHGQRHRSGRSRRAPSSPTRIRRASRSTTRRGNEVNDVVHHQSNARQQARSLGQRLPRPALERRGARTELGPLPPVVHTGFLYLLNQCRHGPRLRHRHDLSAAGIVNQHAPPELREQFLPHLTTMDFGEAWDGGCS